MRTIAVSFDLDETLLDNGFIPDTIAACCAFVAERLAIEASTVAAANAAAFDAVWIDSEPKLAHGTLTGLDMIRTVWRRALAACGCTDPTVLDALVAEHLRLDEKNARLFDDVAPTIEALRSAGYRLGLITNGASDTQRRRLTSLGMTGWFDAVVISSEVGVVKPDARLFARTAEALGVDGRSLWHVGDNLSTDVAGAVAAGHTAVWLNRRGALRRPGDPVPHHELAALPRLLEALP